MLARVNRQILLKSRPEGVPSLDNFALKQGSVPEPGDGEVLMRTRWLSLDPYMRGRMSAAKSYAKPVEVGATMVGAAWLQDRRMQKFRDVLGRWETGELSMMEARELLGMSEREGEGRRTMSQLWRLI